MIAATERADRAETERNEAATRAEAARTAAAARVDQAEAARAEAIDRAERAEAERERQWLGLKRSRRPSRTTLTAAVDARRGGQRRGRRPARRPTRDAALAAAGPARADDLAAAIARAERAEAERDAAVARAGRATVPPADRPPTVHDDVAPLEPRRRPRAAARHRAWSGPGSRGGRRADRARRDRSRGDPGLAALESGLARARHGYDISMTAGAVPTTAGPSRRKRFARWRPSVALGAVVAALVGSQIVALAIILAAGGEDAPDWIGHRHRHRRPRPARRRLAVARRGADNLGAATFGIAQRFWPALGGCS